MDLGPLMQNLGAAGWAVVLVILGVIWRELSSIRENMVTKDGLTIALQTVRKELTDHVADRFQTKDDAHRVANGFTREFASVGREIADLQRSADNK